jgi:hypothetical protein
LSHVFFDDEITVDGDILEGRHCARKPADFNFVNLLAVA